MQYKVKSNDDDDHLLLCFSRQGVDCQGHGTHVAGIVGGKTYGVAKEAIVHGARVLNCDGTGSVSSVLAGL